MELFLEEDLEVGSLLLLGASRVLPFTFLLGTEYTLDGSGRLLTLFLGEDFGSGFTDLVGDLCCTG